MRNNLGLGVAASGKSSGQQSTAKKKGVSSTGRPSVRGHGNGDFGPSLLRGEACPVKAALNAVLELTSRRRRVEQMQGIT